MSIEYERTNYNVKHILFYLSRCLFFLRYHHTPILFYCYYYYYYELELGNMCVFVVTHMRSSRLHDLHLQATRAPSNTPIFNQGHEVFMQNAQTS